MMSNNRNAIIEIQDVCRFLNCDVYSLYERVQIKPNLLSKRANEWLKHNINELIRLKYNRNDNK
ncbi:MAG: hypothetical protein J6S85_23105 [Methanobrevibacter sp.]|nr:hypothetical protein [Methanobrevibacter sp.]